MWQRLTPAAGLGLLLVSCTPSEPVAPEAPAAEAVTPQPTDLPAAAQEEAASHTIETTVEAEGSGMVLVATVEPTEGYHCNMEFPGWSVQIEDESPVLAGSRIDRSAVTEFTESRVVFRIPVADAQQAEGVARGMMRFSVCDDETCLTPRETVEWQLAAAAAAEANE